MLTVDHCWFAVSQNRIYLQRYQHLYEAIMNIVSIILQNLRISITARAGKSVRRCGRQMQAGLYQWLAVMRATFGEYKGHHSSDLKDVACMCIFTVQRRFVRPVAALLIAARHVRVMLELIIIDK